MFSSPNAQANAVVGSRGTSSFPPPRAKSSPSRYQLQHMHSIDRLCSGPSWLTLVYLFELMITWYFQRGASALNIPSDTHNSIFQIRSCRGIYWNTARPRRTVAPPAAEPNTLAARLTLRLGSILLLWQVAGLPPTDQYMAQINPWPTHWTTAIKTATKRAMLHLS